jgi:hypothetical protein
MHLTSLDNTQAVEFHIPEQFKKLAINLSGGADSALLLWLLVDYLKKNNRKDSEIFVLTCVNDAKGRWTARVTTQIIDFIIRETGTTQIRTHYTYYRDVQDVKYFHEVEDSLFASGAFRLILDALTANPPSTVEHLQAERVASRDKSTGAPYETFRDYSQRAYYTPFKNVDKMWIADQYRNLGLINSLFPLTRSCEGLADATNNFTTSCGDCWWCLERDWAFKTV